MPRDAVSRTANVGTVGKNGLRATMKHLERYVNIVHGGLRVVTKIFKYFTVRLFPMRAC